MRHTIIASDHTGTSYYPINNATYTHTLRVNGDRVVTFEIEQTENNQYVFENIGRRWKFLIDYGTHADTFVVQNTYEDSDGDHVVLTVDCIYEDYDILKREMVEKSHTGSKTRDAWFIWLFEGSKFKLKINASPQLAITIDNFGFDSRLSLLFQLLDRFNLEFYIKGDTLFVVDRIGEDKQDYVSYGVNLIDLSRDSEMGDFGTYGVMYGAYINEEKPSLGRYKTSYTHPLATTYGIIPIKPVIDERFKILDNMKEDIKKRIEASIKVSIDAKIDDMVFTERDAQVFEGDTIRFMDERIGLYTDIRIVEVTYTHNDLGELLDTNYVLGDYSQQYNENKSDMDIKNQVTNDLPNKIESTNNTVSKETQEKLDKLQAEYEKKYLELKEGTEQAIDMAGRSGKIYRQVEKPENDELNQGDLWYKPVWKGGSSGWETEMYQYEREGNIGDWRRIMDVEIGDADRLERGSINAKTINLINLNADEIVSGTIRALDIEGSFIKGGVVEGSKIIGADITSKQAGYDSSVRIWGGRISWMYKSSESVSLAPLELGGMALIQMPNQRLLISTSGLDKKSSFGILTIPADSHRDNPKYTLSGNGTISGSKVITGKTEFKNSLTTDGVDSPEGRDLWLHSHKSAIIMGIDGKAKVSVSNTQVYMWNDLNVTGKKNAIHVTRDGVRETPAYEMATAFIGDIGEVVTSPSGMAIVEIPDIFYDIANFDKDYQVFLTPYDFCQFRVTNRTNKSFVIETDKGNCRIGYEIKALRRGYEDDWFHKTGMDNGDILKSMTDIESEELNNV